LIPGPDPATCALPGALRCAFRARSREFSRGPFGFESGRGRSGRASGRRRAPTAGPIGRLACRDRSAIRAAFSAACATRA